MIANLATLLVIVAAVGLLRLGHGFRQNLQACRASGIPFVCLPFYPHGIVAQITAPVWRPVLALWPRSLRGPWYLLMHPAPMWEELYAPFRRMESDTVLVCTPTSLLVYTAAADVIVQVSERRNDFPKPVAPYSIIDIYGKSAISVEGPLWRKHRKVITKPFTEKNNRMVWLESIHQTQTMLARLFAGDGRTSPAVADLEDLTARIALSIISKAGFGVRMEAPATQVDETPTEELLSPRWVQGKTNGHRLSYSDAIFSVSTDVFWLFAFPRSLLGWFPFASARRAARAYREWGQYMQEMVAAKRTQRDGLTDQPLRDADLLTSLVQSAGDADAVVKDAGTQSKIGLEGFSDDEITGNAFLLIMAGYETTAGNLHVALLLLAMHVDSQRRMQRDIDAIFQDQPPAAWKYDRDFARAFDGMLGAVISETLRWTPPVIAIPKWAPSAQPLTVNGAACTIPAGATIAFNVPAAHRNPNQWPHRAPQRPADLEHASSNPDDDLGEFRPERWLCAEDEASDAPRSSYATGTAPGLYRPPRGAYLPFSEGARACLGRRFAQVEAVAVLAVIFQRYSVELATDAWVRDDELDAMDEDQRREVWCQARAEAKRKFRSKMRNLMTNRLTNTHVPIRFVLRGQERFAAETW